MSDCRYGVSPVNCPDPDPECHSKRVIHVRCIVTYLIYYICCYFEQQSCDCCHSNRITEALHINKMLGLPWKQGSIETKFIHFEGIISHSLKGKVVLLIYLGFDVVLSRRALHYINRMEQR